jgi:hypothetical protein
MRTVLTNNTSFMGRPTQLGGLGISPLDFMGNLFGGAGKAASDAAAATQGSIEALAKGEADRARSRAGALQIGLLTIGLVGAGAAAYFIFRK